MCGGMIERLRVCVVCMYLSPGLPESVARAQEQELGLGGVSGAALEARGVGSYLLLRVRREEQHGVKW